MVSFSIYLSIHPFANIIIVPGSAATWVPVPELVEGALFLLALFVRQSLSEGGPLSALRSLPTPHSHPTPSVRHSTVLKTSHFKTNAMTTTFRLCCLLCICAMLSSACKKAETPVAKPQKIVIDTVKKTPNPFVGAWKLDSWKCTVVANDPIWPQEFDEVLGKATSILDYGAIIRVFD